MKTVERKLKDFKQLTFLGKYLEKHKGYIAGGCFKDIFKGKDVKDIDIFFSSNSDFVDGLRYFANNKSFEHVYTNANASCYRDKENGIKLELINTVFLPVKDMLKRFDFSIAKFALCCSDAAIEGAGDVIESLITKTVNTDKVDDYICIYSESFFEDLLLNKLVITDKPSVPVQTFERTYRYLEYGYKLTKESKEVLLKSLNNADVTQLSNEGYF